MLTDIINYYVNLLIVQYHDKPKAQATIALFINLVWANLILLQIRDGFDWRTAEGEPLDIIGKWVGLTRIYDGRFIFTHPWFSLVEWDGNGDSLQGGFSTFETFDLIEGGILDYDNLRPSQNKLNDDTFRVMIGLKIIANSIRYTAKNIDEAIYKYFSGDVYTQWTGNKVIYHYKHTLRETMQIALYKNVLPVPTGTNIEIQEYI